MHKTQRVTLYNGTVLPAIDYKMTQVVKLLNRSGLYTRYCCQGEKGSGRWKDTAYVSIDGSLSSRFLHLFIDDLLSHRSYTAGFVSVDVGPCGFAIRWVPEIQVEVKASFRRVLRRLDLGF